MAHIRRATEADCDAIAEARVSGWRFAYRGLVPDGYLDRMDVAAQAERQRARIRAAGAGVVDLVAEEDGAVAGWASLGPYRPDEGEADVLPDDGELYALYLRPEYVGRGVGRALMSEAVELTAASGRPRMLLWVLRGNARARAFYERHGFAPDGGAAAFTVDGVGVPEVRYARQLAAPALRTGG